MSDPTKKAALLAEAETLPKALLGDIEINWLQVIGEGWAAPLKGFLREGPLMQVSNQGEEEKMHKRKTVK